MTAMMWNALIHSYMVANPRDQTFHMSDGRVRQDAVTKVENKRALPERFEDGVDPTIQRRSASKQRQRIEIALNDTQRLNLIARKTQLYHPIEPHRVDWHSFEVARQLGSRTTRKADDARRRKLCTHARHDARHRLDAPFAEFVGRQHARPGIEDLHGIDTGGKLPDQVARRSLGQYIDELRKGFRMPISEQPRWRLIGRAAARDHIGCYRPWRSTEAQ